MEERQDPADNGLMYSLHIAHTLLKKRKGSKMQLEPESKLHFLLNNLVIFWQYIHCSTAQTCHTEDEVNKNKHGIFAHNITHT